MGAGIVVAAFLFTSPIPQDPAYHQFADDRRLFGIDNFWNVASNLPFLIVGGLGLWTVFNRGPLICVAGLQPAYSAFFAGILLTAFGSAWYHLAPGNASLVWDRLPMTIGFAGLFAIVIGEFVSVAMAHRLLRALLVIGPLSVVYWAATEAAGNGDLRPYAVVQFLPMLIMLGVLLLRQPHVGSSTHYWLMLAFYVIAKLCEHFDAAVYAGGAMLSGHTMKHLFAAMTPAILLYALTRRRRAAEIVANV